MQTGMVALQMVSAQSAQETAASSQTVGEGKVARADSQRKELQGKIRDLEERAAHLQQELQGALDDSGIEKFGKWLIGKDDAGDIGGKLEKNGAEMEKAAKEIQIAQAAIDQALSQLQGAQQDLSGRVSDRQKAYDEAGKAARMSQA